MAAPLFTAAAYLGALQSLLPRGRAWPRDPDATLTKLLSGFSESFEASNQAANDLLVDAFPSTAVGLLPEWESTLALDASGSTSARQAAVVVALTNVGGQSDAYMIGLAAALGVTVTITEFLPYSVLDSVITPIAGDTWAHAWQVNAAIADGTSYGSTPGIVQATPGFGNQALERALARAKPAHTVCITSYI